MITLLCSILFGCQPDSIQDTQKGVFESFDAGHRDGVGERGFDRDMVVVGVWLSIPVFNKQYLVDLLTRQVDT